MYREKARVARADESRRRRARLGGDAPSASAAVYTLGPSDRRPEVEGDVLPVLVLDADDARRDDELGHILDRMHAKQWTGYRPMRPENAWRHVPHGTTRTGLVASVYVENELYEAKSKGTATAVIVKAARTGAPTALVLIEHDLASFNAAQLRRMGLASAWKPHVSYIALLTSSDDAPRGHSSLAMRNALLDARLMRDKDIVCLTAIHGALLYYLRTRFDESVHAFLCDDEETFEWTRAYALSSATSGRGGRDAAALESVMQQSSNRVLFSLRGRAFLEALDYETLSAGNPPETEAEIAGTHVRMWRVARERPLVLGHSYDVALASERDEPPAETEAAGYVVDVAAGAEPRRRRRGVRRFVGEFVGVVGAHHAPGAALPALGRYTLTREYGLERWDGGVAVFENGVMRELVGLAFDARLAFRRTAREHAVFEPRHGPYRHDPYSPRHGQHDPRDFRPCALDELPHA